MKICIPRRILCFSLLWKYKENIFADFKQVCSRGFQGPSYLLVFRSLEVVNHSLEHHTKEYMIHQVAASPVQEVKRVRPAMRGLICEQSSYSQSNYEEVRACKQRWSRVSSGSPQRIQTWVFPHDRIRSPIDNRFHDR